MQQSEFQVNGTLARRGNDNSSWSNRYVMLSTDTGQLKLYIEKSGKKTIKGQLNIRKSKLKELSIEQTGRVFSFEIDLSDQLTGRSDEAILVLAAPDQEQLSTWLTAIKSCFTIGDVGRRRQSAMSESSRSLSGIFRSVSPVPESAPANEEVLPQPTFKPIPVTPLTKSAPPPVPASVPIAAEPVVVKAAEPAVAAVEITDVEAPSASALSNPLFAEIEKNTALKTSSADTSSPKSASMRHSVSFREPAVDEAIEEPPQLSAAALANPMLAEIEKKKALRKSTGSAPVPAPAPAAIKEAAPAVKLLPRRQSDAAVVGLEKKMTRMSYKKPMFKGILGDMMEEAHLAAGAKEAEKVAAAAAAAAAESSAQAKQEDSKASTAATSEEAPVEIAAKKLPIPVVLRKLEIINRPTEPTRMGYLHKLDGHAQELGEDSWITQFVMLEIATGELKYFAEIGGRRILRGTIHVNDHVIHAVDYVYFGRLFSFEILTREGDGEDGATGDSAVAVFAAEDSESFSYWLISMEDCKLHQDKVRQEEEEKKRQAEIDAATIHRQASNRASFTPFSGSLAELEMLRASSTGSGRSSPEQEDVKLISKSEDLFEKVSVPQRSLSVPGPGRTPSFNANKSMERLPSSRDMHSLLQLQRQPSARDVNRSGGTSREFEHAKLSRPPSSALFGASNHNMSAAGDLMQRMDSKRSLTSNSGNASSSAAATSHAKKDSHILDPLIEVNHGNLDDILKSPEVTLRKGTISSGLLSSTQNLSLSEADAKEIDSLQIEFVKIIYPTERLSRRIKLWYCSSGFSISSEGEVLHFVRELRNTDDVTLQAFSHEKFAFMNDWAKLLELLRKYEAHSVHDRRGNSTHTPRKTDERNMTIQIKVRNPATGTVIPVHVDEQMDILALSKEIANELHLSEPTLLARLPTLLSAKNAVLAKGLQTMREDMTFAEDLVLYQEEVIEQMWGSYSSLKSLVEQKDGVINQLYTQLSELQDKHKLLQLGAINDLPSSVFATLYGSSRGKAIPLRDVNLYADSEFNAADLDGDGRISREEWRRWIQDKHNLIGEHNAVKHVLLDEIKMLRKALTPLSEEAFDDLKKSEEIRRVQEEELIRTHIENDNLKTEVIELHTRLKESEHERAMVDADWQEKYTVQQKELDSTKTQLSQLQAQFDELLQQQAQAVIQQEEQMRVKQQQQQKMQRGSSGRYPAQPFSPIQQVLQNPGSSSIANPYTYNMPEDRPTGLVAQQHYATNNYNALLGRDMHDNYNYDSGFDLNSLAQGQLDISQHQQQQAAAQGQVEATRWLQQISGNTITLGANNVSNQSLGTLTPPNSYSTTGNNNRAGSAQPSRFEFRSPDDDDGDYYAYQQPRHQHQQQQLQLQQPLNDMMLPSHSRQYPSSGSLNEQQQQQRPRQSTPTEDLFESKADYSSYASLSRSSPKQPPPPQLAGNADHPLRNALRMEVKMKNHPQTLLAAQQVLPQLQRGDSARRSRRLDTSTSPFQLDRSESPPISYRSVGNTRDPSPFTAQSSSAQSMQSGVIPGGPVSQLKKQLAQQQQQKSSSQQSSVTPRGSYEQDGKVNRAGSPFHFMQQTNSWKSKATPERGSQVPEKQPGEVIIRASNWR